MSPSMLLSIGLIAALTLLIAGDTRLPQRPSCRLVNLPSDLTSGELKATQDAIAVWNAAGQRHFGIDLFRLSETPSLKPDTWPLPNGQVDIRFDMRRAQMFGMEILGECLKGEDVAIYAGALTGRQTTLMHVLTHELGHALDLDHHDDITAVMHATSDFYATTLGASDRMLLCRRYDCLH